MNLNQAGYNHISKRDLDEMCEAVSNLSKSLYTPVNKKDLTYDCLIAESKFSFVPEVRYLVEEVKNEHGISYDKPTLVEMNNRQGEEFFHIHTKDLGEVVMLLREFNLNKISHEKNPEAMKAAKDYLIFNKIREFYEEFEKM